MPKVRQLGRRLQVYRDKELMQRAATRHQTMFEPIGGGVGVGNKAIVSSGIGRELKMRSRDAVSVN